MAEEAGDDKKGLFHKLKALKRRTAQVIAHKIGGAENTIDEMYDEQHDAFLKVQAEMKEIKIACEQTIKCMEALVNQNVQVAEKFQQMFPSTGEFQSVGTALSESSSAASSRISQIKEKLIVEVVAVIDDQLKAFHELQVLHDKRGRRLLDYDAYRRQVEGFVNGKLGTSHPEYSDKKAKQDRSFKEYQSLAERLMIEYHEIDVMKSTLVAAPALALATAQMNFFEESAKDFQVHKSKLGRDVSDAIRTNMTKFSQTRQRYASMSEAEWYDHHQQRNRDDGSCSAVAGGVAAISIAPAPAPPPAAKAAVSESAPVAPPVASKPPPPAKAKLTARALFSYDAANEEELTLVENQIIEITKEDDSGWWQGVANGKEGWFPANYVEKC